MTKSTQLRSTLMPTAVFSKDVLGRTHERWCADTGRRRIYPKRSSAEAYELGWDHGPDRIETHVIDVGCRSSYLDGVWDREAHEQERADERQAEAWTHAFDGRGYLDVER
jgi:hypothetical protein